MMVIDNDDRLVPASVVDFAASAALVKGDAADVDEDGALRATWAVLSSPLPSI